MKLPVTVPRPSGAWIMPAVTGTAVVNYYAQPASLSGITGAGVAVLVVALAWTNITLWKRGTPPLHWILLSFAMLLFTAGASLNLIFQDLTGSFPFPGPADVLFLLAYPCIAAGLLMDAKLAWFDIMTGLTAFTGTGVLLSTPYLISPVLTLHTSVFTKTILIAYPFCDLAVLAVAVAVASAVGWKNRQFRVLGLTCLLVSDAVFTWTSVHYRWGQPSVVNLGWFGWFIFWAIAAERLPVSYWNDQAPPHPA